MNLVLENILDLINEYGEEDVKAILSDFSCPKNVDIEDFLKDNSIIFAKKKLVRTYILYELLMSC